MNLVKEITISNLLIKIYSINPELIVNIDPSIFEGKDDSDIKNIVFNEIGAGQVEIYDISTEGQLDNIKSYSLI